MRRILTLAFAIGIVAMSSWSMAAMSSGKVRKNARFLTDRMTYELNLSPQQMNDVYEINFDFIYNVRYLMDDVVAGNAWALEDYYGMLDLRNDDLRWVLSNSQYVRFLGLEYFNRPIFASGSNWNFRIYVVYPNISFYYFAKPYHYRTYSGGHYRTYYDNRSYYSNRYHHDVYHGNHGFRDYDRYSRDDFKVTARPGTSVRPSGSSSRPLARPSGSSKDDIYDKRPSGNNSNRPSGSSRPSGNNSSRPSGSSSVRPSESSPSGSAGSGRPSNSSTSRPSGSVNVRPSTTPSSGSGSSSRPSGSSSVRPSGSVKQSSEKSTSRPSGTVNENKSTSRPAGSSSRVSERPSSSSSSATDTRSNSGASSGSGRGGRR